MDSFFKRERSLLLLAPKALINISCEGKMHTICPIVECLPNNSPGGLMAESVATRKADLLVWDENGLHDFLKSNPGGLHNVDPYHPIKVMPFELITDGNEGRLRDFLNVALENMDDTGFTNRLIEKWQRAKGDFYPISKPYVIPSL